jgi:hypothetical protein
MWSFTFIFIDTSEKPFSVFSDNYNWPVHLHNVHFFNQIKFFVADWTIIKCFCSFSVFLLYLGWWAWLHWLIRLKHCFQTCTISQEFLLLNFLVRIPCEYYNGENWTGFLNAVLVSERGWNIFLILIVFHQMKKNMVFYIPSLWKWKVI